MEYRPRCEREYEYEKGQKDEHLGAQMKMESHIIFLWQRNLSHGDGRSLFSHEGKSPERLLKLYCSPGAV